MKLTGTVTMRTPAGDLITVNYDELCGFGLPVKVSRRAAASVRTCPNCHKTGHGGGMFRYHFDNCKHKETTK